MDLISEDDFDRYWEPIDSPSGSPTWEHAETLSMPLERVWSIVDGDDGGAYAIAGYHIVNVFGWLVTKRAWTDETTQAVWSNPHCGECGREWDPVTENYEGQCDMCGFCEDHHDESCPEMEEEDDA